MNFRKFSLMITILALGIASAQAMRKPVYDQVHPLTPAQSDLINRAIAREKTVMRNVQLRTPVVETYIQNMRPDPELREVPVSDDYILSRVDFGKVFFEKAYSPRVDGPHGRFFSSSLQAMTELSKVLRLEKFTYDPNGFMDMMFVDPKSFDRQHYRFSFVRSEFLGSVRTSVFDVYPRAANRGFFGRIWIEDQGGNIVRFNGTYSGAPNGVFSRSHLHFDSWRMNMQPNVWLPSAVYVEEGQQESSKSEGLKAQTRFWGYSLKLPARETENVSIKVNDAVDESSQAGDVGPLQASRLWIEQAQNNVVDRLEQAGLVAPATPGGYEQKVLDQIIINLVVPNNLQLAEPVHCRILLTDTIEATAVGNTILLSRGLIDSLPNEPAFAAVISMELAHIALGHRVDTRYGFDDQLLFPDQSIFQRIDMYHSAKEDESAAAQGLKYLQNSMYKNELGQAGLYFEQLQARAGALKTLNMPKLGDSLLNAEGVPWMVALESGAPKIDWLNLSQRAALPLGSWLKIDPWNDSVQTINAMQFAPLTASEKMPFEVTPLFFNLQRYDLAKDQGPLTTPSGQPSAKPVAQPARPERQPASQITTASAVPSVAVEESDISSRGRVPQEGK